jgi:hypothetical protein
MRWLVITILLTLCVGCGGAANDDADRITTSITPATVVATGGAAEAVTPTSAPVVQEAAPTNAPATQVATPEIRRTPTSTPNSTSTPAASTPTPAAATPIVLDRPDADLPVAGQVTATVPVGSASSVIAAGHGAIWVYDDVEGTLSRIDPATNAVVATIPIATPHDPANPPSDLPGMRQANPDLAIDAHSVWVIKPEEQAVVRVDPQSNAIVATIPLGAKATSIAVDESSLWVSLYSTSSVVRIDTTTGEVVATIGNVLTPFGIAIYQDAVWVTNLLSDRVTRIDRETNTIVETIPIAWSGAPYGIHECSLCARDVVVNEHGVWVMLHFTEYIARIDPALRRLAAVIPVGNEVRSLTSDDRGVWVGTAGLSGALLIDPGANHVVAAVPAPGIEQQLAFMTRWETTLWATARTTRSVVRIELAAD